MNVQEIVLMGRSRVLRVGVLCFGICLVSLAGSSSVVFAGESVVVGNDYVLRELVFEGGVWRTVRFAAADGGNSVSATGEDI